MSRAVHEQIVRKLHAYAAGDPQPDAETQTPSKADDQSIPDPAAERSRERQGIRQAITRKLVEHAERFYVDSDGRQHELMPRAPEPEEAPEPELPPVRQIPPPIDQGVRGAPAGDERAAAYREYLEEHNRMAKVNGWDYIDVDWAMRRYFGAYVLDYLS